MHPPLRQLLLITRAMLRCTLACAMAAIAAPATAGADPQPSPGWTPDRTPDVVYIPTPQPVVDRMLEMAGVGPDDILYDLGSGDGRIPITAARRWGTRGAGIELKADLVAHAEIAALRAGVADKVRFQVRDIFEIDFSEATVVTLYLLPTLNLRLRDTLQAMKPGSRVVSHAYDMGSWTPDRVEQVGDATLYLWIVREPPTCAWIDRNDGAVQECADASAGG